MTISLRRLSLRMAAMLSCAAANLAAAQPAPQAPPQPLAPYAAPPVAQFPAPPATAAPVYDAQQLPATRGRVARYTLTPRGDVDGLLLADGTEVRFPPHLSAQLVYAVRPGDSVTVRGLRAINLPLVAAVSITNDASGQAVVDDGPGGGPLARDLGAAQPASVQGRIQAVLHGPRGEVNGTLLEDGTILRLPPPEAERFAALLTPGQTIAAQGDALTTPMGRVMAVQAIGPSATQLSQVDAPPPPRGPRDRPPLPRR